MPHAAVGDIELYYETFGESTDVPILLINGLGSQSIRWLDLFCEGLADRFFHVIRFDNRDVGLSSRVDGPSDLQACIAALASGGTPDLAYTLSDMAADAAGLLDVLGIEAAHVVGMSMGGMIAQHVAIEHPNKVLSLTSIMSSTGNRQVGQPSEEARYGLFGPGPDPDDRDACIAHDVKIGKIWSSPDYWNEEAMTELAAAQYDRGGSDTRGVARQSCATVAQMDRDELLQQLDVPALVIHGALDTLVNVDGGEHTAEMIPNAELLVIENMSHDWPPELFGPITEAITQRAISV